MAHHHGCRIGCYCYCCYFGEFLCPLLLLLLVLLGQRRLHNVHYEYYAIEKDNDNEMVEVPAVEVLMKCRMRG